MSVTRARFLSLARSKLRLCSANHRPGYWSNLPCDWPSTAWAYSEQETENGPWCHFSQTELTTKGPVYTWWRHQMETFSSLLALCEGGIHHSPLDSARKGQWRWAFICIWINGWANHRDAGDLRCHCAHYDATVMYRSFNITHLAPRRAISQPDFRPRRPRCQVVGMRISSDSKFPAKQKFHAQACHTKLIWLTTWRKMLNICPILIIYFRE